MNVHDTTEFKDSVKRTYLYEFWVEQWMDDGKDIVDCYQIDLKQWPIDSDAGCTAKLLLKRYAGTESDGCDQISHAYVVNGVLESFFDTTHKVPQRYIDQCNRYFSGEQYEKNCNSVGPA